MGSPVVAMAQLTPRQATSADLALCYMLQTHLCYTGITPDSIYFRVLKQRLDETGFVLVKEEKVHTAQLDSFPAKRGETP